MRKFFIYLFKKRKISLDKFIVRYESLESEPKKTKPKKG